MRFGPPLHPDGTEEKSVAAVESALNALETYGHSGSGLPDQIHAM